MTADQTNTTPDLKVKASLVGLVISLAVCFLCLPVHFSLVWMQSADLVDDAYISARYARNLAEGHGLVYNRAPGDNPRVEGYSNFLWTIIIAQGLKWGSEPKGITHTAGIISNLASILLAMFMVYRLAGTSRWAAPAVGLTLALNLPLAIWAVQGMETPLMAMLVLPALIFYQDGTKLRALSVTTALAAALSRPDGILVFAALVVTRTLILVKRKERPRRADLLNAALFLVPYYAYLLWRFAYYGSFLPNTYYAKVGLGAAGITEGLRYVSGFMQGEGLGFIILLLLGSIGLIRSRRVDLLGPVVFILLYLGFIIGVGGDFMPNGRFMVHMLPVLMMVLWIGLSDLEDRLVHRFKFRLPAHGLTSLLLVGMVALSALRAHKYETTESFEKEWHRDQSKWYMPTAVWVLQHVWQGETVAVGDIGYIGYISDVDNILDTHGLVDKHLARLPGIASLGTDLEYVLDKKPRFIVSMIHEYPTGHVIGHTEFDRQLASSERFKKEYRLVRTIPGWESLEVSRTDMIERESLVVFNIYYRKT